MSTTKKNRILVVEDEEAFRDVMRIALEKEGFEVTLCPGAKQAQHLIGVGDFDVVITDIRMPEMTGIELLHFVKRTKQIPVILMTGFTELKETCEASSLGAHGFIAKPFTREELLSALRGCFSDEEARELAAFSPTEDYLKLCIDDFISGRQLNFDIFIKVAGGKFVKIAHKGEDLAIDRIRAYKSKGVTHLHMLKEDFRKYIGFNLNLAHAIKSRPDIEKAKKLNLLKHTGEVILERLYSEEIDKEVFDNSKCLIETAVTVIADDSSIGELLVILNAHSDALYAHSLAVSLYSVMIGRKMPWNSPLTLTKLAIGGFLHDIGQKELDKEVLKKPRIEFSPVEARLFESHPKRGMEILSQVRSIPTDVLQIVLQHHEDCSGLGYPSGLKRKQIHPLARVVSLADEFAYLVLKGKGDEPLPPKDAINRILSVSPEKFEPLALAALVRVFKGNPPTHLANAEGPTDEFDI